MKENELIETNTAPVYQGKLLKEKYWREPDSLWRFEIPIGDIVHVGTGATPEEAKKSCEDFVEKWDILLGIGEAE